VWYLTQEFEVVLQPGLASADHIHLHHIVLVEMVAHIPGLGEDKALVVEEEAKLQVVEAELHMVPSVQRHLLDQVEMAQTRLAFESSDLHMELHSVGNMFHPEPAMLHSSDRFETDYS